jgi:hypothetical protein
MTRDEMKNDIIIPNTGATTIKITILSSPAKTTELRPAPAIAAPTSPPTSVCDELEGNPHHHVRRFHVIAATRAAAITVRFTTLGSTFFTLIVLATCNGKTIIATKLNVAASKTAENGDKTLVETTVAIEFAES